MRPTTGTGREEEAGETTEQMPVCSSSGSGSGPKRGLSSAQKQPSAIYVARGATTGRLDMEMGRDAKASLSPLGSCEAGTGPRLDGKSFGLGHDTTGRPKVDKGGNHPAVVCMSTRKCTSGDPTPKHAARDAPKGYKSRTPWLYLDSQHKFESTEHDKPTHRG